MLDVNGKLLPLSDWCEQNGVSRTSHFFLKKLGRAPAEIRVGRKILISPEATARWRAEMAANPINGGLAKAARG
jgi:hypothetical protein